MNDDSLKYFVFASIISAENDEFTEEVKQEIISRYNPNTPWNECNWEYILEPIGDEKVVHNLASLLNGKPIQSETLQPSKESTESV